MSQRDRLGSASRDPRHHASDTSGTMDAHAEGQRGELLGPNPRGIAALSIGSESDASLTWLHGSRKGVAVDA